MEGSGNSSENESSGMKASLVVRSLRLSLLAAIAGLAVVGLMNEWGIRLAVAARQSGTPATQEKTETQESDSDSTEESDDDTSTTKPKIRFELGKRTATGPILRARRPSWSQQTDLPFYADFYSEALAGSPPDWSKLGTDSAPTTTLGGNPVASEAGDGLFDSLISPAVIEDEIKRSANLLTSQITTPVKFRSDYRDVHQTYSQLTMLFAINEAYAGEVRWHDDAPAFRELMGKTAAGTRVSTQQAYQMAVQSRDELQQIVRGGRASVSASDEPLEDWGTIIDRTPLMTWLESLVSERMRTQSNDETAIKENKEELLKEAELVAAIAQVLVQPEVDEFDDDDYAAHAQSMKQAALQVRSALQVDNFQGVQDAINAIQQSCDDCHGDFR